MLIAARETTGLTQIEVAEALGRPQSFVSKYEIGERRIDVEEFLQIADALQIDAVTLLRSLLKNVHES
jgi:transcriptional regulator with XRE-family HTH domain